MKIYLDLIFFINFFYDYLLLLFLGLIEKRQINKIRLIVASFIGTTSVIFMFININSFLLFVIKITTSIIMVIISYKFISIKYIINNLLYFYMLSIILAGFLYFLNINFSYEKIGAFFVYKGISPNYMLLVIISPLVLIYEYYCHKKYDYKYNYYYKLEIYYNKQKITCMAFLDSGNNMIDPISNKPVIIINEKYLKKINIRSPVYVPYNTLNSHDIMECFKPSYIMINNHKIYNYLIGKTKMQFKDGIGALLNNNLRKDNYV